MKFSTILIWKIKYQQDGTLEWQFGETLRIIEYESDMNVILYWDFVLLSLDIYETCWKYYFLSR